MSKDWDRLTGNDESRSERDARHRKTYREWVETEAVALWGNSWRDYLSESQIEDAIDKLDSGLEGKDKLREYIGSIGGYDETEEHFAEQEKFLEHEYEMMLEYSPKMAKLMFDQYKEYAPQITGIQQGIADDLYPEIKTLRTQVGARLAEGPTKLDDITKEFYQRSVREAQSDRGFLDSPAAGRAEGEGIVKLARQQYDKDAALALSLPRVNAAGYNASNDYYSALGGAAAGQQGTMFNQGLAQQTADMNYQKFLLGLEGNAGQTANKGAGALGGAMAGYQATGNPWGAVIGGIAGYYGSDVFA
jgi:hypothetical protein